MIQSKKGCRDSEVATSLSYTIVLPQENSFGKNRSLGPVQGAWAVRTVQGKARRETTGGNSKQVGVRENTRACWWPHLNCQTQLGTTNNMDDICWAETLQTEWDVVGLLITTHTPRSHTLIPVMLRYRLHCQEDSVLVPIPLPALPSPHPSFASVSTQVPSTLPSGIPVTLCLCLEEARPWPDSTICLTHPPTTHCPRLDTKAALSPLLQIPALSFFLILQNYISEKFAFRTFSWFI